MRHRHAASIPPGRGQWRAMAHIGNAIIFDKRASGCVVPDASTMAGYLFRSVRRRLETVD
ncbi:hypothetical protein IH86_01405 [Sphingobium yanoikuyae]|nr:hypothetical protein IH86_01405 [Sphingobium yanoikuyae]